MKKRYSDEQIVGFLREADAGVSVKDLCRRHGFSEASFYLWRGNYGGMSHGNVGPHATPPRIARAKNNKCGKNTAAPVRDRLLALARERGEDFQLLLTRYGLERLLYRLNQSRQGVSGCVSSATCHSPNGGRSLVHLAHPDLASRTQCAIDHLFAGSRTRLDHPLISPTDYSAVYVTYRVSEPR